MKLYRDNKQHGEVISFEKTGMKREAKQFGQSKSLEVFEEYELVSTKKVYPELAKYEIEDEFGVRDSLDISNEEPEKTKEGYLIHVYRSDT